MVAFSFFPCLVVEYINVDSNIYIKWVCIVYCRKTEKVNKMEITKFEMDVIKNGFGKNEFEDDGSPVWSNSIIDTCEIVTKSQISGVIGSLVKKGLAVSDGETTDATTWLTDTGKKILNEA